MQLNEFKAFIEGLEHGFRGDAPSPEQWQLVKDKLHQVGSPGLDVPISRDGTVTIPFPHKEPYFGHEPVPTCEPFYPIKAAT